MPPTWVSHSASYPYLITRERVLDHHILGHLIGLYSQPVLFAHPLLAMSEPISSDDLLVTFARR